VALGLIAFCGMLALAVDVGTTSARYQAQRHAANTAAYTGAYTLYGGNSGARGLALGANSAVTDTTVLNAIITTLSQGGLSVAKVITTTTSPTPDPCNAGYQSNQVAMKATYLTPDDEVITKDGSPWLVGSGSIPGLIASGIQVTLGSCHSAGFGGVTGHPRYTIWATGLPGGSLPGADIPPTAAASSSRASPCPEPYAVS